MIRSLLVMVLFLLTFPCLGQAQEHGDEFVSGTQLAQACASRYPTGVRDCDGFIAGVLDTVAAAPELKGKLCPPPRTRLATFREALGTFGQQHPDATHGSGVSLLVSMMKANYPCPGG